MAAENRQCRSAGLTGAASAGSVRALGTGTATLVRLVGWSTVARRAGGNPDCRRSARVRIAFRGEGGRIQPAEVAERRLQLGMRPVPPGDTPSAALPGCEPVRGCTWRSRLSARRSTSSGISGSPTGSRALRSAERPGCTSAISPPRTTGLPHATASGRTRRALVKMVPALREAAAFGCAPPEPAEWAESRSWTSCGWTGGRGGPKQRARPGARMTTGRSRTGNPAGGHVRANLAGFAWQPPRRSAACLCDHHAQVGGIEPRRRQNAALELPDMGPM